MVLWSVSARVRVNYTNGPVVGKNVNVSTGLEARATHLSAESHVWQARARAQEVEAAALQSQLQQAIVNGKRVGCCVAHPKEFDKKSSYIFRILLNLNDLPPLQMKASKAGTRRWIISLFDDIQKLVEQDWKL
ncbi:hypothetical protein L2E82_20980 [Cichorium intybus]|uniref:Uncharacterized protein n=1 Tax=Cichorium intybus TaxID=13427 RepID=A0ACB9DV44_CICIN|nr:hypothetical protein L2E82_20980 [Cichorium intybus]